MDQVLRGRPLLEPPLACHWAEGGRGPTSHACPQVWREGGGCDRPVQGALGRKEEETHTLATGSWMWWPPAARPRVWEESARGTPRPVTTEAAGFWGLASPLGREGTEANGSCCEADRAEEGHG